MRRLYYLIKPWLPRRIQILIRNRRARFKINKYEGIWPIDECAGNAPANWKGWPEGKRFALVLTHDVERRGGLDQVKRLAELEIKQGFRSSFNFVPGDYLVGDDLRNYLLANGFEVGVHGYTHKDGNLFRSERYFRKQAVKINTVLNEWGAVGFRTPCMYHDLEKVGRLNIEYDSSTFDTDPFEPQPDGVQTIFPFWVENQEGKGFVELPYTLIQDFTLFIVLGEKDIGIWKKKVDWIAEKGGMALLLVHPDYLNFQPGEKNSENFPLRFYEELLSYIKTKYHGEYWHRLPREVAVFWKNNYRTPYR
jgi:hypothetical protein